MPRTGTGLQELRCHRCKKPFSVWLSQTSRKFCSEECRESPVEERFWAKVDKSGGPDACWNWKASVNPDGYGNFMWKNEQRAHRVAWILTNGPISDGLSVLHEPTRCNNRTCCNPAHLYLGTQFQNVHDMIKIGTKACIAGENHANSLLNTESIIEIRKSYNKVPVGYLVSQFKVTVGTIRDVAKGRSWQSVTPKNYWDAQGVTRKTRQDNAANLKA